MTVLVNGIGYHLPTLFSIAHRFSVITKALGCCYPETLSCYVNAVGDKSLYFRSLLANYLLPALLDWDLFPPKLDLKMNRYQ